MWFPRMTEYDLNPQTITDFERPPSGDESLFNVYNYRSGLCSKLFVLLRTTELRVADYETNQS